MNNKILFLVILISLIVCLYSIPIIPKRFPLGSDNSLKSKSYQSLYFTQKISHFNYKVTGTFKQKYLIDLSHWDKNINRPILFYCGNQGPIQMFYRNSGFYNDVLSEQLKGIIVYPEHRYFGESMPFGDQKNSYLKQNLVYLTTEEALMDYVEFLKFFKKTYCKSCPVVAFGGSYGGMLATWIRIKYPFIVDMAHAASAPIYYYRNRQNIDLGIFFQIVTKNYELHNSNCPNVIREAFNRLNEYSKQSSAPIDQISAYFNLCRPLRSYKDIPLLMQYLNDGFSYMAMLNYPYPTSFLKNLTAWPANSSCLPLDNVNPGDSNQILFSAVRKSVEYYYSYGKTQCNQIFEDSTADEDLSGWNILACGDQAMPMKSDGVKDMFYPQDFDYSAYSAWCKGMYGIQPDYDYTLNHFGGVTDQEYLSATKIIFTNGGLDPWSGASPTTSLSDTLVSCFIRNCDIILAQGAHHLDLRPPNAADPASVKACRDLVRSKLNEWLGNNNNLSKQIIE